MTHEKPRRDGGVLRVEQQARKCRSLRCCVSTAAQMAWSRAFTGARLVRECFCSGSFTGGRRATANTMFLTSTRNESEPLTLAVTVPPTWAQSWTPNHGRESRFQEPKNVVLCQNNQRLVRRSGFTGVYCPLFYCQISHSQFVMWWHHFVLLYDWCYLRL